MVERSFRKAEVEGSTPSIGLVGVDEKYNSLSRILRSLGRVVVAYSGGVDSTFLLKAAIDAIGPDNVLGCIGVSSSLAKNQHDQAIEMAGRIGADVRQVDVDEMEDSAYTGNKADRCFHCKLHLFGVLREVACREGFDHVICGSNFDDKDDYRPGNRAAQVLDVGAPLMEAQLSKDDIRRLSRKLGLATADMPASPCLASRISYGLEITEQRLRQVERAEDFLRSLGLVEFRVRHHGDIARIETRTEDIEKITANGCRGKIVERFKTIGFKFVSLDLQGFRSGSLNEALSEQEKHKHL